MSKAEPLEVDAQEAEATLKPLQEDQTCASIGVGVIVTFWVVYLMLYLMFYPNGLAHVFSTLTVLMTPVFLIFPCCIMRCCVPSVARSQYNRSNRVAKFSFACCGGAWALYIIFLTMFFMGVLPGYRPRVVPSMVKLGGAEVYFLGDLDIWLPASFFYQNTLTTAELNEFFPGFLHPLHMSFGCTLVKMPDGRNILLDTGAGPEVAGRLPFPVVRHPFSNLLTMMKSAKLEPENITHVLYSHLHTDHVGWSAIDDKPTFPNAAHIVQKVDHEFFIASEENKKLCNYELHVKPIEDADLFTFVTDSGTLIEGAEGTLTPGHTPGHQIIKLTLGDETLYYLGDLAHSVQQFENPDWVVPADVNTTAAAEIRKSTFAWLAEEKARIILPHTPYPGYGRIESNGKGAYKFVALSVDE